jgi:two-component system CheB/CheR fusion protein
VNDLLEVSRAGQGRFELQPQEFDLAPLVRDVVQRHDEIAADDGRHRFSVDAPASIVITGDAMRIEQALVNLVGNAVKYSPSGGEVRVAVAQQDGMVAIAVSDEGIGIAADELPNLARPFARGSKRARTFSGMGIGLYLARLVAERHGGSLALASDGEDKGTTVTLQLPREMTTG